MEMLKLTALIITIGCISFLTYLYMLKIPKITPTNQTLPPITQKLNVSTNFCDAITNISAKNLCVSYKSQCEVTNPADPINCVAGMLAQVGELEAVKQVCSVKSGTILQQFCSAISFALVNVTEGLKECDLIEGPEKYHCRADVWKEAEDIEKAIEECDKIKLINETDTDSINKCKASVYRAVNITEALDFCKRITNLEMKEDCESFVRA